MRLKHVPQDVYSVVMPGLQRALPFFLGLTFLVIPSVSLRIFKAFSCFSIDSGNGEVKRFLQADPKISCDSGEYTATRYTSVAMIIIWPVGVPLMYTCLLALCQEAVRTGNRTPLSRATRFLWEDYSPEMMFWEPIEMCRKLALTGWVLLIGEEAQQARVLLALLISVSCFGARLYLTPLRWANGTKRKADDMLMTSIDIVLIISYLVVLVIKTCDQSLLGASLTLGPSEREQAARATCSSYGFGSHSTGETLVNRA
eukprot:6091521-Prymnesium_polylepis.1